MANNTTLKDNAAIWAMKNQLILSGGEPFTLDKRMWQLDVFADPHSHIVIRKAAQVGVSVIETLRCIYGLHTGRHSKNAIVLFPTGKDVERFSKTRIGNLLADNPSLAGIVQNVTNSTTLKKINDSFLVMVGATANTNIKGVKDSTNLRSISADALYRDEYDVIDPDMAQQSLQRLNDSQDPFIMDVSTPKIPLLGIDLEFQDSDQKHWFIHCEHCDSYHCLQLEFPNCVRRNNKGEHELVCTKCNKPLNRYSKKSQWVALKPENKDYSGYTISQLAGRMSLDIIMKQYKRAEREGRMTEFMNSVLGMPHVDSQDQLTIPEVLSLCGNENMSFSSQVPTAIGIDVGRTLHAVIGIKLANKLTQVIAMHSFETWDEIHELIRKYNVKSLVIDSHPELHAAEQLCRDIREQGVMGRTCTYTEGRGNRRVRTDIASNYNRTDCCDRTVTAIKKRRIILPRLNKEVEKYAQHLTQMARTPMEDTNGESIYRYVKLSENDHYFHAMNYFMLATDHIGATARSFGSEPIELNYEVSI